jgi:hypothetical protein
VLTDRDNWGLDVVVHTYNSSHAGGIGKRIAVPDLPGKSKTLYENLKAKRPGCMAQAPA